MIGEVHGSKEIPELIFALAKILDAKKKKFTVALEMDNELQGPINKFLKTDDFAPLLQHKFFQWNDGRSSLAMKELLYGLRQLKRVRVLCFDINSNGLFATRDSTMGVNLASGMHTEQMIVLTGNLHANLKAGYWKPDFKSALYHFKRIKGFGDELVSLNMCFDGGTIWNCMQDGCKERPAYSNPGITKQKGFTEFIMLNTTDDGSGYDGYIYYEKVNASPPVIPMQ